MYGDQEQQPSFTRNTEWRDPASGDTITMLILQRVGTSAANRLIGERLLALSH